MLAENQELERHAERYEVLEVEPLQVELVLMSQAALYSPLTLDGLLSAAVVAEATDGNGLPDSATPYCLPLPLHCLWRQPESDLPLWATTEFGPLEENEIVSDYWHKRAPRPEMVQRRGGRPWNIRPTQGRYKEYRIPLPRQSSLRWGATCMGNRAEVERLLGLVTAVGKKRSQGRGLVDHWRVRPLGAEFSLWDEAGCSLRPIPGQMIEGIPLDMVMLGWTPPYWHSLCQALCLTVGYEGEVVYDGSG